MSTSFLFRSSIRLPDRVAFSAFGINVYWYGVFLALGVLITIILAQIEVRRKRLGSDTAIDLCLLGIPLGIVGARLYYVFTHLSYFKNDPLSVLTVWDGGLSLYGAVIGALLAFAIYSLAKRIPLLRLADVFAPGLALAQGLACWGDFFNQQGYGPEIPRTAPAWFPFAVLIEQSDTIHYAVFFYEFLWCVLLFMLLWFVMRKRALRDGTTALCYLLLYSLCHAAFSLLRVDTPPVVWKLSLPALLAGALFLLALALLLARRVRPAKPAPAALCEPLENAAPAGEQGDVEPYGEQPCNASDASALVDAEPVAEAPDAPPSPHDDSNAPA